MFVTIQSRLHKSPRLVILRELLSGNLLSSLVLDRSVCMHICVCTCMCISVCICVNMHDLYVSPVCMICMYNVDLYECIICMYDLYVCMIYVYV